jgi:protein O-GlcNAc transferase
MRADGRSEPAPLEEGDRLIACAVDRLGEGDIAGMVAALRAAVAMAPGAPTTALHMAEISAQIAPGPVARLWLRRIEALAPGLPATLEILARLLKSEAARALQTGDAPNAPRLLRAALALVPGDDDALMTLASQPDAPDRQERALERALALRPWAGPLVNLGNIAKGTDRTRLAISRYRRALAIEPASSFAWNNMATTLRDRAELGQAVFSYRCALWSDPEAAATESNYLQTLQYDPSFADLAIADAHRRWDARHAARYRALRPPAGGRDTSDRPLRIGYVSADLKRHPVGFFLLPVLQAHDRARVRSICYATRTSDDELAAALRSAADAWVPAETLDDDALAARIRADHIDILVDLSGHTAHHRLLVFARRPAPVQVSWLGYFDTTGLSAIDYLVTDAAEVPPGRDDRFTERVVRLPSGRFAYRPPAYAPPVARRDRRAGGAGVIVFGSFNNLAKLADPVVALWARVLAAVDGSRLVLKWPTLADPHVAEAIRARFARHGIAADRLDLRAASPHPAMLAEYGDIDIALDPFPFSGCLTTVEALWMGVPVVALNGGRPVARQSAAILGRIGLADLVADSEEGYLGKALALAGDADRRAALRGDLRRRMAESTLLDGRAVAADLENAYLSMWLDVLSCEAG